MAGFIIRNTVGIINAGTKDMVNLGEMDSSYLDEVTTIIQGYEAETVRMCNNGQWAGIWQVSQMVHVLQRPIRVHYPDQTPGMEKLFCKEYRRVFDLDNRLHRSDVLDPVHIAWTVSRNGVTKFDHFVSVVK